MISVIIRNRNEAQYLKSVFEALSIQDAAHEVILVDNNSTDESREIAAAYNAKIVHLEKFSYGRGLNVGLEAASSEICVILSAHSLPLGTSFLSECAKPFTDKTVAAARCLYAGKSADALRWLKPQTLRYGDNFFKGILASGCVIRRSVWEQVKFDENLPAVEDKFWTRDVLKLGYTVISPIPAFYYYLKSMTPIEKMRKNYRELVVSYSYTGEKASGFIKTPLLFMMKDLVVNPFAAAYNSAKFESEKLRLKLMFPK